ncbi:MAG: cupredoxin domain-containing protein [Thermomicrobiales bacterium]
MQRTDRDSVLTTMEAVNVDDGVSGPLTVRHRRRALIGIMAALGSTLPMAVADSRKRKKKKKKKHKPATPPPGAAPDLVLNDFFYTPNTLAVRAAQDVPLLLRNDGGVTHTFVIDALAVDVELAPGASRSIVINAPANQYAFYCRIPGHKAAGMTGTLNVA